MPKILVIDDDLELQDLYKFTFENAGYEVFQAFDGKEGLTKISEIQPDIVILDIIMPEMNGFEVMQEIRLRPEMCLIPVIMLTSLSQAKDKLTGLKLGADDYLVKPLEPYELLSRVDSLLKKYYDTLISSSITHLPGRTKLESEIKLKIEQNNNFSIIHMDFNHFKGYNSKYGYEQGDNVLKLFAGVLRSIVTSYGNINDFISHLGGDKFVILSTKDKSEEIARNLVSLFNDLMKRVYDEETLSQGYFVLKDKEGKEEKVPLMTLAIGVSHIDPTIFKHSSQVLDYVTEVWLAAKNQCLKTNQNAMAVG
jgi:diguanylate cyclase (GGDEF)-like protein